MTSVHVARNVLSSSACAEISSQLVWTGSLGPAGHGNRCTQGRTWQPGERHPKPFADALTPVLAAKVLPIELGQIAHYRAWGSSTPAGVGIDAHAHDADVVLCVYLSAPKDAEPLEFISLAYDVDSDRTVIESVEPEAGTALLWPSALEHRVPQGAKRDGDRICVAFNIALRPEAA